MKEQANQLLYAPPRHPWRFRLRAQHIPLLATFVVCLMLYTAACIYLRDRGFFSLSVFISFFSDNAFLGLTAIGMTFVILSGGIDLSVGSMIGFTSILIARLMNPEPFTLLHHTITLPVFHPLVAIGVALIAGSFLGFIQGVLIQFFELAPFLVTLAGMFFIHGVAQVISLSSIGIDHPLLDKLSDFAIPIGSASVRFPEIVFAVVALSAIYISRYTKFGRTVYAIGGNEQSAILMGLPVARTKVLIYALSGFCSALGGVIYALAKWSGQSEGGLGLELDTIAAVVIGGTLLTGGLGSILGTILGVLIVSIIQAAIIFQGTLSSSWARIMIGALLFVFIVLQKILSSRARS
jgi:ribose/xylose/arabinose/galactoside ABC-type transport system permease subunit